MNRGGNDLYNITTYRANQKVLTMTEEDLKWYYVRNGEQVGPVNIQEIQCLVEDKKIGPETKVWDGEGDWKTAKNTDLSRFFKNPESNIPPPLIGADIDNKFVWAIVAIPIIGSIIQLIPEILKLITVIQLALFYFVANTTCCILDMKKLKAAGQKAPISWMVLIIPVYLWKRADLLNHKKHYFWAWIAVFISSVIIDIGINEANVEANIEETACPLVTNIIKEQLYQSSVCKGVSITKQVSDDFYKAVATLDNGNDLQITIENKGDGMIYVRIPNQQ